MSDRDEVNGVPDDDASQTEAPIESGRSATEEEREDPTRTPSTGPRNGEAPPEGEAEQGLERPVAASQGERGLNADGAQPRAAPRRAGRGELQAPARG
jgi:hypothetical protein